MIRITAALTALALAFCASGAQAGEFTDGLTTCLTKSTTDKDRQALVVWIFAIIAEHPDAKPMANITSAQRDATTKQTAELMQRLMTEDCRKETAAALKYEGSSAIELSFSTLGELAMTGLMSHPAVEKGLEGLSANLDKEKFKGLSADIAKLPSKPRR